MSGADDPTKLPALELARAIRSGELRAEDAARACLERARALDDRLGAFLHLDDEEVLTTAREVDARLGRGESLSPLAGVPVAIKDNLCTTAGPTTCGSRILEGWRSPYDATVVTRLREAGCVPFGKTNLDEFAMGSSCEHSAFRVTTNPHDASRVPGGSSGGSAAAVGARCAPLALGSDTGGSIRQPAAFCGVVGLKPTYGRVSRHGLVAFASSLDQVGPFARSVADAAECLRVIGGIDPYDATSADEPPPELGEAPKSFRFGVPPEAEGEAVSPSVRRALQKAIAHLESLGGERVDVALPHAETAVATYYIVATAEASSNLARYDGVRYGLRRGGEGSVADMMAATRDAGFGPEVKRRILLGTYVLSAGYHDAYYRRANRVRSLIARDFDTAFESCDVLLTPTTPTTAFAHGDKLDDPVAMYLSDVFTVPANLAGLPGVSVPCDVDEDGLPCGAQLVGPRWSEGRLLSIAAALEQECRFEERHGVE